MSHLSSHKTLIRLLIRSAEFPNDASAKTFSTILETVRTFWEKIQNVQILTVTLSSFLLSQFYYILEDADLLAWMWRKANSNLIATTLSMTNISYLLHYTVNINFTVSSVANRAWTLKDDRWYALLRLSVPGSLSYIVDTEKHFHIDFPVDPIKREIPESSCSSAGHRSHFHGVPWTLTHLMPDYFTGHGTYISLCDRAPQLPSHSGADPLSEWTLLE